MWRLALLVLLVPAAAQGPRPNRENQQEYSRCLASGRGREACRELLGGGGSTASPDPVREQLEAERGASGFLAEMMMNCTDEFWNKTGSNKTFKECRDEAMAALERLRGKRVKPEEFEAELRRIASEAAEAIIDRCLKMAADAAKPLCYESAEAKDMVARLTGRMGGDVEAEELRGSRRESSAREMAEELSLCRGQATTASGREDCLAPESFRETVGNARGKGSQEVKDSEVREFLEEGALDEVWSLLESCPEGSDAACATTAKGMLADALGKDSLTDDEYEKLLHDAMEGQLGGQMRACVQGSADETGRMACRTSLVGAALERAGGPRERGDEDYALEEAARNVARDMGRDCTDARETCMERLRESAAESMGRRKEELTEMELERLNMRGSSAAAKDAATACTRARQSNASASCEDVMDVYREGRKKDMDDSEQRRVRQDLAKDLDKENMQTCFGEASQAAFDACLANFGETDRVKDDLFGDLPGARKEAKKKKAKDDAAVEAMGEMFQACMKNATMDSEKAECRQLMQQKKDMAGLQDDLEDVIKKYQGLVVATAARVCAAATRQQCMQDAKAELREMGLKDRAFGVLTQMALLRAAAETYAACQEASEEVNATCISEAKAELEELSGSTEIWTQDIADKVQELGDAYLEGRGVMIRKLKQLLVEAVSDLDVCSSSFLSELIERVQNASDNFGNATRNVTDQLCRITFGKARFLCRVHAEDLEEAEMANLSEAVDMEVSSTVVVRRLGRSLATVTETYVDQEQDEVAESSASASSTTAGDTPDTDSSTTRLHGPVSKTSRTASFAGLALCGLVELVAMLDL